MSEHTVPFVTSSGQIVQVPAAKPAAAVPTPAAPTKSPAQILAEAAVKNSSSTSAPASLNDLIMGAPVLTKQGAGAETVGTGAPSVGTYNSLAVQNPTSGIGLSRQDIEKIMGLNQGQGPTVAAAAALGSGNQNGSSRAIGTTYPNYTEPAGPESTVRSAIAMGAQTLAKIQALEKNNPALGKIARELFGQGSTSPQKFIDTLRGFDKVTRDRLMSLFSTEILLNSKAAEAQGGTGIGSTGGGFNIGGALNPFGPTEGNRFQGLVDSIDQSVSNQISRVNETFKPVSTFLGETLGNLSSLVQDPIGTIALIPGSIKNVIERNFPDSAANIEATYKKYNLDNLMHMPSILAANLGGLISDIDALISLPFILIHDLYLGLMDIINDLADAIQQIISNFLKKLFTEWLDGILLKVLEVLQELSDLFGYIGGITTIFTGVTQFTQILFNVQSYITQLGQFISNPLDLLFAYAPPQVSQALYLIRNPQQLINDILPPQLSELFAKVSQITGFGFNGNMGYGFVSVLEGVRGGVIASILSNFANQYPILTSILGLLNRDGMTAPNAEQPPITTPTPVAPNNEKINVNKQGIPTLTQQPKEVIPTKEDFAKMMGLNQGRGPTNAAAAALAPMRAPAPVTPIVNTQGSGVPVSPSSRLGPALTQ